MAWRRPGDKPLSEPRMESLVTYASLGLNELMHVSSFDISFCFLWAEHVGVLCISTSGWIMTLFAMASLIEFVPLLCLCILEPARKLTHWGRATHICVGKLTIIGSDNDLSPGRRQAIIWTNAGILLIEPLGTNVSESLNRNSNIFIYENAQEKGVCEMASILSRPQCVNTLFSVVKCKRGQLAMHRSCISRLVCIEPPVCYLSPIEHNVMLCTHHYCACFSFSGGLHASGQIWPNMPMAIYISGLQCYLYFYVAAIHGF